MKDKIEFVASHWDLSTFFSNVQSVNPISLIHIKLRTIVEWLRIGLE